MHYTIPLSYIILLSLSPIEFVFRGALNIYELIVHYGVCIQMCILMNM